MSEANKNTYLSEFLFYVGFKTTKDRFDALELSEKIEICAYQAYLDFCRTVNYDHYKKSPTGKYIENDKKKKIKYNDKDWAKLVNELLELFYKGNHSLFPEFIGLIDGIEQLMKAPNCNEYDKLHESLCKSLCTISHSILEKCLTIGQAQKWVNMTMKYLWMLDLVKCESSILHIPIDNYVLGELKQKIGDSNELIKGNDKQYTVIDKKSRNGYKWSNIPDYKNVYYPIQKAIREKTQCPIEWESQAWLEATQKLKLKTIK